MAHIKNVKVRNPKNVQVQIPGFISTEKWQLKPGDVLEVEISDDGETISVRKRKVQTGSDINEKSKGLFVGST